jgi:hypothetical protein
MRKVFHFPVTRPTELEIQFASLVEYCADQIPANDA